MSKPLHSVLSLPAGFRSREVALHLAELADQSALQFEALDGASPTVLHWQPAPGRNTIGMLLAHQALVEVYWTDVGLRNTAHGVEEVLGIGMDDDGIPCPPGGAPPAHLAGRELDWYRDLHQRARTHLLRHAQDLTDTALDTPRTRTRLNGQPHSYDVRWVLYHLVEHFAGHHGQILMLQALHRDVGAALPR
jgi:hypothetical protein